MKTLPNGQIQIEQGDTLWNIYGANWKQLSGYTGDPTKLQIGTILPAPNANVSTGQVYSNQPYSNTPIITSEQQQLQNALNKAKQQLEETTAKMEKAKVWVSSYPGATSTSQIPDWVLSASSPEEVKKSITPERIKELETTAFQMPTKSFKELWDEVYKDSKLPNLEQKITDTKSQLYSAEGKINENPWYSEAGRVGQVRKLYDIAQKDISNLTDQYNTELDKVKMIVNSEYKESQTKQELQQKELDYLLKKRIPESQWPANSPETYKEWMLAGGQKGTGMSYANYVKERTKAKVSTRTGIQYKIPTEADVNGFMQWFSKLQATGGVTNQNWISMKNSWLANGFDPALFDKTFGYQVTKGANEAQNKSDAMLLQNIIDAAGNPVVMYQQVILDPDVPAEVKQYLKSPIY